MTALSTLRSSKDFLRIRRNGRKSAIGGWAVLYFSKSTQSGIRFGCTLPRYVGTAVTRNRLKRWSKEHLRKWAKSQDRNEGLDLSLVFRQQTKEFFKDLSHKELDAFLERNLQKVG